MIKIKYNKKAVEMSLNSIITLIILIIVLIVVVMFFSEHFSNNNTTLINVGNDALNSAKNLT